MVGTLAVNAQVSKYITPYNSDLTPLVPLGTSPNQASLTGSFAVTLSGNQLTLTTSASALGIYNFYTPTVSPSAPAELRMGPSLGSSVLVGNLNGSVTTVSKGYFGATVTEVALAGLNTSFAATPGQYWIVVKGLYGAPGTPGNPTDILSGTFTVVPEPETYAAAAALGLVGFGLWRRRNA